MKTTLTSALRLPLVQPSVHAPAQFDVLEPVQDEKRVFDAAQLVEELTLLDHHRRCDARGKSMILISASVASKSSEEHAARPRCEVIDIGPKR